MGANFVQVGNSVEIARDFLQRYIINAPPESIAEEVVELTLIRHPEYSGTLYY